MNTNDTSGFIPITPGDVRAFLRDLCSTISSQTATEAFSAWEIEVNQRRDVRVSFKDEGTIAYNYDDDVLEISPPDMLDDFAGRFSVAAMMLTIDQQDYVQIDFGDKFAALTLPEGLRDCFYAACEALVRSNITQLSDPSPAAHSVNSLLEHSRVLLLGVRGRVRTKGLINNYRMIYE